MDFLGQTIATGDYVLTMKKGSGWDKSTYFDIDVVVRMTDKTVFTGKPDKQKKIKMESVLVITHEQLVGYITRHWGGEGAQKIITSYEELREEILK